MKHDCLLLAEHGDEPGSGRVGASLGGLAVQIEMNEAPRVGGRNSNGLGLSQMADGIGRYWFVAAVFRDLKDLVETIGQMRAGGLAGRICIVTNHAGDAARRKVARGGDADVSVVAVDGEGTFDYGDMAEEPAGMRMLLQCMASDEAYGDGKAEGADRSQVYAQLHDDVRQGAFVLLASVDGPDDQVVGARLLLKGNCECVLTHEISASAQP